MFATVPRMRAYGRTTQQQEEERPVSGMDSTYGIRSLDSEADWGMSSESVLPEDDNDPVPSRSGQLEEGHPEEERAGLPEVQIQEVVMADTTSRTEGWVPPSSLDDSNSPASLPVQSGPPPEGGDEDDQSTIPQQDGPSPLLSLSHAYLFEERDNLSEPSSPASFASMPSYMSSLSRTSSLAGVTIPSLSNHQGIGIGMGGSEELVMPLLNVSQGLTSPRWGEGDRSSISRNSARVESGRGRGIKVVVLGDSSQTERFIHELREVKEVIQFSSTGVGEYAVIGGDEIIASISTGTTGEDVSPVQHGHIILSTSRTFY